MSESAESAEECAETETRPATPTEQAAKLENEYVKLNVGGTLFQTTKSTLQKGDTMLSAMFSGNLPVAKDSGDFVLIDRSGQHFGTILNFLRDGSVPLPSSRLELEQIRAEAEFYCIKDLQEKCTELLEQFYNPKCVALPKRIIHFTLNHQETEFLLNPKMHNQMLAIVVNVDWCSISSMENGKHGVLVKNFVFFRDLAEKHSEEILFIYEMLGVNDFECRWRFYIKRGQSFVEHKQIRLAFQGYRSGFYMDVENPESEIMNELIAMFAELAQLKSCPK